MTDFHLKAEVGGIEDEYSIDHQSLQPERRRSWSHQHFSRTGSDLAEKSILVAAMSGNTATSGRISVVSSSTLRIFSEMYCC